MNADPLPTPSGRVAKAWEAIACVRRFIAEPRYAGGS